MIMRAKCGDSAREIALAKKIAEAVGEAGGTAYFVGGFVRDELMGRETKDVDVEIHGITPDVLALILSRFGTVTEFGKSFGICGIAGYDVDIALPRSERKTGAGHRDFNVSVDPFIGVRAAAKRRDFTVNALMKNVLTGEITDCFGGMQDIENSVIRHVDDVSFAEDPLRVLRAARFSAQLGFKVDESTINICKTVDITKLSRERVCEELKKALMASKMPSTFFRVLRSANALSYWFSELEALIGLEQNPAYHPEGDVFTHTMLVLDSAAKVKEKTQNAFGFMLAALVHDFGKAETTETVNGVIHAYGHEEAGVAISEKFLHRLTDEKELIRYVKNLVALHMKPHVAARNGASVKSTNNMFDESVDPQALVQLALCDSEGTLRPEENERSLPFLEERLKIYHETVSRPAVGGEDLIKAGLEPGEAFSEALRYSHKLLLAGIPKEQALKETLSYIRSKHK